MLSYNELLTAATAEPLGGGRGDTVGEDGVWQGLLCHLQGQVSCWMGNSWEHGAETAETAREKEVGIYFRTKSHIAVAQF